MNKYLDLSLIEINDLLKKKVIKPLDLVLESFNRIEENSDLNAFITLNKEEAIRIANELENKEVDNLLFGIPIAIKDNICTLNLRTTCASHILDNFIPIYDASVIKLIKDKKMIIIGKTNMDEFAMGSSTETSYYGICKNPIDKTLVPGGSSGGSAAAVSSNLVPFALGTDTGGSIRQPSAFTNIVGLKPTYGRVSRYGLVAFASSLDQIGPMTRNVYENAILLNAICQKDEKDLTSVITNEDFTKEIGMDIKGLKIAIPNFYVSDLIDKVILKRFNEIVELLKDNGAIIDYVDIKYINYAVSLYQIIALGEASSNLARFDGIRYGYSKLNEEDITSLYTSTRSEGFGEEVKRRIMIGSSLLSGANAKKYYNKALMIRDDIAKSFYNTFKEYDLIIGPTTTSFPYKLGSVNDAVKSFLDDILTIPVNMAGLPGLSLPIGEDKKLPIGMQIIANKFNEARIYRLASFIENKLGGRDE
ncbi:MAG: Asp-tRNA(Asn)/Glu-tRNA(Gln) amidotransferase subunit GatA [Bacilli bacterium]